MPDQLPLEVFLGWAALFAFICAHAHHEKMIKSCRIKASGRLLRMVEISSLLGLIIGSGILIFYFIKVRWYWAFALAIFGSFVGAISAGLLFGLIGEEKMSKRAFIGWPLAAIFTIFAIIKIAP